MPRYRIEEDRTDYLYCYVEADTEDAAIEEYTNGDYDQELKWADSETTRLVAVEVSDE